MGSLELGAIGGWDSTRVHWDRPDANDQGEIGYLAHSPSPTQRMFLLALCCMGLGESVTGNIKLSFPPLQLILSHLCTTLRCYNILPEIKSSCEGFFHAWMIVYISVSVRSSTILLMSFSQFVLLLCNRYIFLSFSEKSGVKF